MANIAKLMKQAAQMQRGMQEAQEKLAQTSVEAEAGGGAVKVVMSCANEVVSLTISPDLVASNDPKLLEDVVMSAMNQAAAKVRETTEREMGRVTGGMSIPGLM
ncbi:MAG: YbaB/EbfC family nucleoid-associated protein [Verrucomicrobiae bacterium]|nr:YbaB/EbfC family nucleoid-associated protein [Verrucomicrobiae bacterium]MCP5520164.1 YbaB/EbfC family nucleoid-associated protein [Verrucomicrobiales bacterium]